MNPLLTLQDVTYTYPDQKTPILESLNFELHTGQRIGLIGPNGQGKTTLLHLCLGLLRPDRGAMSCRGAEVVSRSQLQELRHTIGLVFQSPEDQLFCPTVLEDVAFGPLNQGLSIEQARDQASQTLDLVGLHGFEDRITHKLSGGEKKLLSLATVLAMHPDALLLDEPTTGLDPETRNHLIALLNNLEQTLLIVSHDWDFLHQTTTRLVTLDNGRIQYLDHEVLHQHVHVHSSGDVPHEHSNRNHVTVPLEIAAKSPKTTKAAHHAPHRPENN